MQRQNLLAIAVQTRLQIRTHASFGQCLASHTRQGLRIFQTAISIQHLQRLPGCACQSRLSLFAHRAQHRQTVQHLHKQTRQWQPGPLRVGGHMHQHHLPLAHSFAGHQRRAIAQAGNHPLRQCWVRLRHHLCRYGHFIWHRQAIKWAIHIKRCERFRLTPTHCAPHTAPTRAQAHRQQRVFLGTADLTRRQTWPGKAQQQATGFQPVNHCRRFALRQDRHIRQNNHIRIGG
mmetsp:Transcript_2043/g.3545  ORF Transcript_2043/g.3545 Transcript_2043/m.3545 type:complete len:232 (+) Transcript_2043:1814-2509(+)